MTTRRHNTPVVNTWNPKGSRKFFVTHDPTQCFPKPCCVHRPSKHHMKDWPQNYRDDIGVTERVCVHNVGHPDPDQPWPEDAWQWIHGCCGCCLASSATPTTEPYIDNITALLVATTGGAICI